MLFVFLCNGLQNCRTAVKGGGLTATVTYMHTDTHAQRSRTGAVGDYAFSRCVVGDLPDLVKTPGYINEVKSFQVFSLLFYGVLCKKVMNFSLK